MVMQVLGKAAVEAAQALSEKFGIATFNLQGKVNTLPLTRPYDTSINIGSGSTGLTSSSLNTILARLSPKQGKTQEVFSPQSGFTQQPVNITLRSDEIKTPQNPSVFEQISPYSGFIVLGFLSLVAISLLKRSG